MNHNEAFGIVLRRLRESVQLSQDALAACAGVHRTYIHLLETGQRSPTLNTMFAMCEALNVEFPLMAQSIDALMNNRDTKQDY